MAKKPRAAGLIFCERMDVDVQARQLSLVGIFNRRESPAFPTPPYGFTVYAVLYDATGEGTIELVITQLETEIDTYRYTKWLAFPPDVRPIDVEIRVTKCVFPQPGRYLVQLRFDNEDVSSRWLGIYQYRRQR